MVTPFKLLALVEQTESDLICALDLEPVVLPSDLGSARGAWKGGDVSIRTNAYRGPRIGYARFAYLDGRDMEIGNVLFLPDPNYPLPILGADLVAAGGDRSMIAADLSPTLPMGAARSTQLAELVRRRAASAALPSGGVLPTWCAEWFSPYALYTRVTADQMASAAAAYRVFPHVFTNLAQDTPAQPTMYAVNAAVQAGYLRAHRTDDRGIQLLRRMFGEGWTKRYVDEVLFPIHSA